MRINASGRYGVRAILQLALSDRGKPISIRELSSIVGISPGILEQIFFNLRKSGIVKSTRGPSGGFQMDRNPAMVTVKDIFDATGEEIVLTLCTSDDCSRAPCSRENVCLAYDMWVETADHINGYFKSITIQDILKKNQRSSGSGNPNHSATHVSASD